MLDATANGRSVIVTLRWRPVTAVVGVVLLLASRVGGNYATTWLIGSLAVLFIAIVGRAHERLVLFGLVLLALRLGGDQAYLGLRHVLFVAQFMLFARYLVLSPALLFVMQSAVLVGVAATRGEGFELFLFTPAVMLLLIAAEIERKARQRDGRIGLLTSWRAAFVNLVSLGISTLGLGSRSALFVWLGANAVRLRISSIVVVVIVAAVVWSVPGIPMIEKLKDSVVELTQPINEATGGASQRAIEGLIFVSWLLTASPVEILGGAASASYIPGELLAKDDDVRFVPHNQVFGLLYQFGILGCLLVVYYLRRLYVHLRPNRTASYMMLLLLLPCFLFKHGFLDTDLAMIFAVLNWMRFRGVAQLNGSWGSRSRGG